MIRRDDKYDPGEEAKPVRAPRRLRREDDDGTDKGEGKTNTARVERKESSISISDAAEEAAPKPRRRRADNGQDGGGWMSSAAPTGRGITTNTPSIDDQSTLEAPSDIGLGINTNKHFDTNKDEGEILMIPDLEEDGGGDGDGRVARAPRNLNRKIPTLTELENDARAAIMMRESGLDLTVLLNTLVPPAMVEEDDVPWTFEGLLRDITDELLPLLKSDDEVEKRTTVSGTQ